MTIYIVRVRRPRRRYYYAPPRPRRVRVVSWGRRYEYDDLHAPVYAYQSPSYAPWTYSASFVGVVR